MEEAGTGTQEGSISPKLTLMAPFQASCALPKPSPRGKVGGARGQILQPLENIPLYHTPRLFGCNVLSQNKSQGSVWALSGSSATAHAEGPRPWRKKAPSSPAPALAWVTCSWPGEGKDKCHLACSRRSGRTGDGKIPSDSQIPPWFSCGLILPCALRKRALSTPSCLHYQAETPLCPSQPLASPFPWWSRPGR